MKIIIRQRFHGGRFDGLVRLRQYDLDDVECRATMATMASHFGSQGIPTKCAIYFARHNDVIRDGTVDLYFETYLPPTATMMEVYAADGLFK